MYKKLIKLPGILSIIWTMAFATVKPVHAQQAEWSGVCVGTGGASDVATIQGLECLIANIFTVAISFVGMAAFLMFIVGGFMWLVSGGKSSTLDKAKGSFTYAVIGLVVALSAFIIINMISAFTGVNIIRNFVIPTS